MLDQTEYTIEMIDLVRELDETIEQHVQQTIDELEAVYSE